MTWTIEISPELPTVRILHQQTFTTKITGTVSDNMAYSWFVDGVEQEGEIEAWFDYTPQAKGVFHIVVYASDQTPETHNPGTYLTVKGQLGRKGRLYGR